MFVNSEKNKTGFIYNYQKDGKIYPINNIMLNSLFRTYGYCVDPTYKSGKALSTENINKLSDLATKNKDIVLIDTINALAKNKAPSPKMVSDDAMYEITVNEQQRYYNLETDTKIKILEIMRKILDLGLYLGGWLGKEEPYIKEIRPIHDNIRMELKINPLIEAIHNDSNYAIVKNFPIIKFYDKNVLKPIIIDINLNIEKSLNRILLGVYYDEKDTESENSSECDSYQILAEYLIATSYYYITIICDNPLPMLIPLIINITKN